ncbi:MAG: hypothetical protein JRI23_09750, partial [Deltaproteobacteria bacterium]|nr:hypothetical protein [Deltaproteobacteria bacterium]MBW2531951.1 hypothetical protein [Deltaproteobacteria bacterium]
MALFTWCASPAPGHAEPTPEENAPRGQKKPKDDDENKKGRAVGPMSKGMLRVQDVRKDPSGRSGGGGRLGRGGDDPKPAPKGKGDKKGGKGAGDDDDDDDDASGGGDDEEIGPWSNINAPAELAVGIDYQKPKRGTRFSFNLVAADLTELIKIIGNITGKSFILGGKVPNIKATIYAPTKITTYEAYQAFLSVLRVNGLTVIPAGRYLKILSVGGATGENTPIFERQVPGGDQIVTRLHPLDHVSAEELAQLLDRFKSADGDITVYTPTNTLIITDYVVSITRLLKLINLLDVPGTGEQIWIEPINYADATELADRIMEIFDLGNTTKKVRKTTRTKKSKRKTARTPSVVGEDDQFGEDKISKIIPDERTNSLIIVS